MGTYATWSSVNGRPRYGFSRQLVRELRWKFRGGDEFHELQVRVRRQWLVWSAIPGALVPAAPDDRVACMFIAPNLSRGLARDAYVALEAQGICLAQGVLPQGGPLG